MRTRTAAELRASADRIDLRADEGLDSDGKPFGVARAYQLHQIAAGFRRDADAIDHEQDVTP